jgi:uncharacterized protein YegJ (DUF2314 family)
MLSHINKKIIKHILDYPGTSFTGFLNAYPGELDNKDSNIAIDMLLKFIEDGMLIRGTEVYPSLRFTFKGMWYLYSVDLLKNGV